MEWTLPKFLIKVARLKEVGGSYPHECGSTESDATNLAVSRVITSERFYTSEDKTWKLVLYFDNAIHKVVP